MSENPDLSSALRIVVEKYGGLPIRAACRYSRSGIPQEDLVQIATIRAAEGLLRHDPNRGAVSSAIWLHALAAIRGAIRDQLRLVRVPRSTFDKISRIRREASKLEQKAGRALQTEEVAEALGESFEDIEFALCGYRPLSLVGVAPGTDTPIVEAFAAPDEGRQDDRELLRRALQALPDRDRAIVLAATINEDQTAEVGRRFGISRERCRQIRAKALARMRRYIEARHAGVPPLADARKRACNLSGSRPGRKVDLAWVK